MYDSVGGQETGLEEEARMLHNPWVLLSGVGYVKTAASAASAAQRRPCFVLFGPYCFSFICRVNTALVFAPFRSAVDSVHYFSVSSTNQEAFRAGCSLS